MIIRFVASSIYIYSNIYIIKNSILCDQRKVLVILWLFFFLKKKTPSFTPPLQNLKRICRSIYRNWHFHKVKSSNFQFQNDRKKTFQSVRSWNFQFCFCWFNLVCWRAETQEKYNYKLSQYSKPNSIRAFTRDLKVIDQFILSTQSEIINSTVKYPTTKYI